jgi:hypothetical protein
MHLKASTIKLQVLVTAAMRTDALNQNGCNLSLGPLQSPNMYQMTCLYALIESREVLPDARPAVGLGPKAGLMNIG